MSGPLINTQRGDDNALRTHLANTIGAEVEAAMNNVGWEHSMNTPTPPAPPANPEAASTPPPESGSTDNPTPQGQTSAPTLNWDEFRDANGMILGKYRDPGAAVKGMHSLLHMAKSALSERDAIKEQLRQQPQSSPQAETRQPVQSRNPKLDLVLSKVEKGEGLDNDDVPALIEGITEQANQNARRLIEERDKTAADSQKQWGDVDTYMGQHHPQSLKFVDEMKLHIDTNPEVGRVYNRLLSAEDPGAKLDATLYAWSSYAQQNPHVMMDPVDPARMAQEQQLQANAQIRKEMVDQERKNAGLHGSSASGVHETVQSAGPSREEIEAAIARRSLDNGASYRALTIVPTLNHPIFDN